MKCLWENCDKETEDIYTHIENHTLEAPELGCKWEDCSKKNQSMSKNSFVFHVRQHGGPKTFKCLKCEKNFARIDALNKHLKKHEADNVEIQQLFDKIWYCGDLRDLEEIKTIEMLRDRQVEINCHRILHQFINIQKKSDNWKDYL